MYKFGLILCDDIQKGYKIFHHLVMLLGQPSLEPIFTARNGL